MLAADRAVANTQEQMVPFLLSMWLHAVVVSPQAAAPGAPCDEGDGPLAG